MTVFRGETTVSDGVGGGEMNEQFQEQDSEIRKKVKEHGNSVCQPYQRRNSFDS